VHGERRNNPPLTPQVFRGLSVGDENYAGAEHPSKSASVLQILLSNARVLCDDTKC